MRRKGQKAMRRLREILEEASSRGGAPESSRRVTVAGG